LPLQADNDLDLITITLRELGELKWTDIVSPLQEHVFLSRILKKEKVGFHAGTSIQFNVQVNPSGAARMTGMMATDVVNIADLMTTAVLPWRHANTNWGVDLREIAMNREPRKIVDIVKERRAGAMISLAELLETQGWTAPTSSTDSTNMFGIPYWIVPNATQGFNGGNPFGFSAGAGGLSSTTYPNWANYTDQYVDPTKLDLIRRWRRAAYFTNFMSPVNTDIPTYNTGNKYGYYTTYFIIQRVEEACEQQNDNLGNDIASKDGQAVFRRNPIVWVPKLDALSGTGMSGTFSNSTYTSAGGYAVNPVLGINWGVFRPVFLEGWYMREDGPYPLKGIQHTVAATQIDLTINLECRDRRRQFCLTQ
jgi:hypothetical protein